MQRSPLVLISGKDVLEGVGGHESYVRAHALAAQAAGFEPHIFCMSKQPRTVSADFGVVHGVGRRWRSPPVALQGPLLSQAVVAFLAERPGPHVIHGFAIWSAAGVLASRALGRRGVRAVPVASAYGTRAFEVGAMQRGLRPHHGRAQSLRYRAWLIWIRAVDDSVERWGYVNSRFVLVNYESVRNILASAYGSELAIRRIPYASTSAFEPADTPPATVVPEPLAHLDCPDAPLVLAASRHDPRKGLDLLLLALGELASAGVAFRACLVGPGRLLGAHRRLAGELGLGGRVAIPGRVQDVGPYLSCAEIFVLPSLGEASGSVSIIEALRAGKAVIASACDGVPEDLVDDEDALLVEPGSVGALAGALNTLLTEPAARERLAANARAAHEQKFSAERFVSALASLYAELGVSAASSPALARTASAT